jgi:hypothetical protein
MTDLPAESMPPEERGDTIPVQEIVSPVQPAHAKRPNSAVTLLTLLVATFVLGYLVYGRWPEFGAGIKVAQAPELIPGTVQNPGGSVTIVPAPGDLPPGGIGVAMGEPLPRISSIATEFPNIPMPAASVPAGTPKSVNVPTNRQYIGSGCSLYMPAGARARVDTDTQASVSFINKRGALLAQVEIVDTLLTSPTDLGAQLALSPEVSGVSQFVFDGYVAYRFTRNGYPSLAVVQGSRVFYIVDYSGTILDTFKLN